MSSQRRARCAAQAGSWIRQEPLILDTETTGMGPDDEVVQVAVVDIQGNVLLNTLVRPSRPISPEAASVHKITNADVANAPTGEQVCRRLAELLRGRLVCIYNADFDTRLLAQTAKAWGVSLPNYRAECVMKLYAEFAGEWSQRHDAWRWHKLQVAAARCGLGPFKAHDALEDARMTARLLRHIGHYKEIAAPPPKSRELPSVHVSEMPRRVPDEQRPRPRWLTGCAVIAYGYGLLFHLFTVLIAFFLSGPGGALLTFIAPFASEVYWFFAVWQEVQTPINLYTLALVLEIALGVLYSLACWIAEHLPRTEWAARALIALIVVGLGSASLWALGVPSTATSVVGTPGPTYNSTHGSSWLSSNVSPQISGERQAAGTPTSVPSPMATGRMARQGASPAVQADDTPPLKPELEEPRGRFTGWTDAEWRAVTLAAMGREMGLQEGEAWVAAFYHEHGAYPWQVGPSDAANNMLDHLRAKGESERTAAGGNATGAERSGQLSVPETQGCYVFRNYLGVELTITFTRQSDSWNDTFKVMPSAEQVYCLDPGRYTYTIDAPPPWEAINGDLSVQAGDFYAWPVYGQQ